MRALARQRLRDNIRRLFEEGEVTYTDLVRSGAVSNSALARIVSDEGQNASLELLDYIGEALGVEPWQLLHPDFEVAELSTYAMLIAQKMDEQPAELRERLYALFVQAAEFGNVPEELKRASDDAASVPGKKKPKTVRRIRR